MAVIVFHINEKPRDFSIAGFFLCGNGSRFGKCQDDGDSGADIGKQDCDQQAHNPFEIAIDVGFNSCQAIAQAVETIVLACS